jgi:ankyrin repeat protein
LEMVQFLIESGADKEAKDNAGWTPLHLAAAMEHLEIVKFLVESGSNKDAKDDEDKTPLQWAQHWEHTSIVDYLKIDISSE